MTNSIKLHKEFLHLAKQKHAINYKLLALLPQIYESGIYKQFTKTIEGYAWKFAQIPETVVRKRLKLEPKLEDKPHLKKVIAEVGIHKVAIVVGVATPENESLLAEKIKTLSKNATQELSKELRQKESTQTLTVKLDTTQQKIWETLRKQYGHNLNDQELFVAILQNQINIHQVGISNLTNTTPHSHEKSSRKNAKNSRYIPAKQKRTTQQQYDNKCAYPTCHKPADHIHHPDRYAKVHNHENLVPLCRAHHDLAHHSLIDNENLPVYNWRINLNHPIDPIDLLYQQHKLRM